MTDFNYHLSVYLVDDDKVLLEALSQVFELDDLDVIAINKPESLLSKIDRDFQGIVVTDVRMPVVDGLELFERINAIDPEIPIIFVTGHADVPMVLGALRQGAFDFFSKPIDSEHLLVSARKALETRRLVLENRQLRRLSEKATKGSDLIGETPEILRIRSTIEQIAQTDIDVLIEGETGTGKEVIAELIHRKSNRATKPFVAVNCAAIPQDFAEVEFFGSAFDPTKRSRGARIGKIEESHNGVLFLDEIEYLSTTLQGQLLPVVEERRITTSIGDKPRALNLRIIASSQIDLSSASEEQGFRKDLLYRLNTVKLSIPPLRERKEDVPLLFSHFISQAADKFGKKIPNISSTTKHRLVDYDWPGNVRELKNFAFSLVLGIDASDGEKLAHSMTLPQRMERFEANTIRSALEQSNGDVRETIALLGIPRKTFYDKLSRHEIDINIYRNR